MKNIVDGKIKFFLPKSEEWLSLKPAGNEESDKNKAKQNQELLNQQLLSAMKMQNLVVLAGCGTSQGKAGGPSMKDLWDKCTKTSDADKGKKYTDEAETVFKETIYNHSDESKVNIEEFLSICEAHLIIKNNVTIKNFVASCKKEILSTCNFTKTEDKISGHSTFIHRLSRRRVRDSRLKIFTTNYDTCFEEAAASYGIVVIDGFSFSKPRVYDPKFFDIDIVKRTPNSAGLDNYLEGVFQLYKLHGSVTWEKENKKIIEKEATPDGACMIFPAKGKYQQSYIQPHLELMARYLAALREANTCLIITGFGFNDDHLSEPIMSAIDSNPYLKVIIADPSAEANIIGTNKQASPYWSKLKTRSCKGEDITFINAYFEDLANLIPDLRSLTPAEKVANAIKNIAAGDK
jgi:hypothetical protein